LPTLSAPETSHSESLHVCTTNTISFSFSTAHAIYVHQKSELCDSFYTICIVDIATWRIGAGHRIKDEIKSLPGILMAGDQFEISGLLAARLCG
jgi:hypothetical protein